MMQVHRTVEQLPLFLNAVVTIGTFDGVHQGHQEIIAALINEAKRSGGESVIITFDPHPRRIVNNSQPLQLINTLDEKIGLLAGSGIDHLVIVPFTPEFAAQSADEYIRDFLVAKFHPHTIIIGYDHRFGQGRKGDLELLEAKAPVYGYQLMEIPRYLIDEIGVSSTQIRKAILQSDTGTANKLLGYDFFFEGKVILGDQLGRKLGYPTANLQYTDPEKIHLGHGVYAVYVEIGAEKRKGMLSIGVRPTLEHSDERIEVNIFDWDQDIYDAVIRVRVHAFMRQQEKYPTLDALIEQLHRDREKSLELL